MHTGSSAAKQINQSAIKEVIHMPHDVPDGEEHEAIIVEDDASDLEGQVIVDALQKVLVAKGLLTPTEVTQQILKLEAPGTHLGARIAARAVSDPDYKERLMANGKEAAIEIGVNVGEAQLIVVENTATTHNLVVCTLCSSYPRSILGQPPSWYVSKACRSRTVREPRLVPKEFGTQLSDEIDLVVHDSNGHMRYLVPPQPPDGHGSLSNEALEKFVTRDHMIGVVRGYT